MHSGEKLTKLRLEQIGEAGVDTRTVRLLALKKQAEKLVKPQIILIVEQGSAVSVLTNRAKVLIGLMVLFKF